MTCSHGRTVDQSCGHCAYAAEQGIARIWTRCGKCAVIVLRPRSWCEMCIDFELLAHETFRRVWMRPE